jgi:ArsR family transcriptional regulator
MNPAAPDVDALFAALGDRMRLRLACCLHCTPSGACVCELVDALDVAQPNVSRHLSVLRAAGLVEERRDGRWMYYQWRPSDHPLVHGIRSCIETVCCANEVQEDVRRLRTRLNLRRDGKCVRGTRMLPGRARRGTGGERRVRLPLLS